MDAKNGTNGAEQPFTWCDPDMGEHEGSIPHRRVDGWVKVTRWNGQQTVVKVETVRLFGHLTADILYPERPKGLPLYDDMFLGGRTECITEADALAWLQAHNLPLPEGTDTEQPEPVHQGDHE
jgi:hypothetical protein